MLVGDEELSMGPSIFVFFLSISQHLVHSAHSKDCSSFLSQKISQFSVVRTVWALKWIMFFICIIDWETLEIIGIVDSSRSSSKVKGGKSIVFVTYSFSTYITTFVNTNFVCNVKVTYFEYILYLKQSMYRV